MKLVSWNVNGFRAISAKPEWEWFNSCDADIIALQETKVHPEQLDETQRNPEGFSAFWQASHVKKGYSGVAVFSRQKPLNNTFELPDAKWQGEGRLIHLEYPKFHFFNVYFPNGQQNETRLNYKLGYYDAFLEQAEKLRKDKPIVVCGDFNTAHRPIDLARPKENEGVSGFLPIERAWLDKFTACGYIDTLRQVRNDEKALYSWWSYRMKARARNVGWRIDYFFVSSELKDNIKDAWIENNVFGSDHCPVGLELDI
ncbi:exodeoxyribonuclease III [Desulfovibrio litoralis]|uniref:Exodeoxyribonuclease-3 n=1 Tax=Desulfovibrio litoralis DSM 11393 TaxID=1121455 RepID=A0A1M7S705_9BACT|nr:exodeoxyribonuclease III [Desulfovibrio litoralis]SHN54154.1 exodeoxyribonuclease-3 [Desulfovibrio litoralis DSM 11393]